MSETLLTIEGEENKDLIDKNITSILDSINDGKPYLVFFSLIDKKNDGLHASCFGRHNKIEEVMLLDGITKVGHEFLKRKLRKHDNNKNSI